MGGGGQTCLYLYDAPFSNEGYYNGTVCNG